MKRSEVLKVIGEVYSNWCEDCMTLDINDSEKVANFIPLNERILSRLEELGMLPPSTDYFIRNQPLGFTQTWEEVADYHQWEPEEE